MDRPPAKWPEGMQAALYWVRKRRRALRARAGGPHPKPCNLCLPEAPPPGMLPPEPNPQLEVPRMKIVELAQPDGDRVGVVVEADPGNQVVSIEQKKNKVLLSLSNGKVQTLAGPFDDVVDMLENA